MIPVSRVQELFDAEVVAPGKGNDLYVGGGGYPEQAAGEGDVTYVGGLAGTKAEVREMLEAAGPGRLQVGGRRSRRQRTRRNRHRSRRHRSRRRRTSTTRK
jgi:hypothetical protein